ncbi:hypothetical protein N7519_011030 [Penicillium mononematosum]|uniref:uncharacterized protein n=1 Tax=Penicillium mononematosum TaxID=268346 RepID=UPI0025465F0C|nr:uncharacterized protein N7519_011030 [Penicillium mononematosum]KAJ6180569.1 hypothetical protein N7519_011030 [Penicillium mononematosum]
MSPMLYTGNLTRLSLCASEVEGIPQEGLDGSTFWFLKISNDSEVRQAKDNIEGKEDDAKN